MSKPRVTTEHPITAVRFELRTGRAPKDDDLERCNCKEAGQLGHLLCGWCAACGIPVFFCGHSKEQK